MVNRRILFKLLKRLDQLFGPWVEGACVLFVKGHARIHIFLGVCGAVRLMLPDGLNELFGEAREKVVHALGAERDRGRRIGYNEPLESFRCAGGGIFSCQHT